METFVEPRGFVENLRFAEDRQRALQALDLASIDEPIRGMVRGLAALPHLFTLQSCYGHFLCTPGQDTRSLARLPSRDVGPVTYRIAYVAFCLESSARGRAARRALARIPAIDEGYVQFGSAGWFWERHPNSYALQVEPARYATRDEAVLDHEEALHTQRIRDLFFVELEDFLEDQSSDRGAG